MNVRYRVELTQYDRNELGALLSGVSTRRGSSSGPRSCWRRTWASARMTSPPALGWRVDGLPDQAALCRRQPGAGVSEEARPGPEPKMTGKKEALLVAGFGEGVQMIIDLARDSADQRRG